MTAPRAMRSGLYAGEVFHKRFAPRTHFLKYGIFQILLDLDAPEYGLSGLKTLSLNRFNWMGFHEADHGPDPEAARTAPLNTRIRAALSAIGLCQDEDRLFLMTMPRVLGFVFNPISLYFTQRPDGTLRAIVYEVNNTFGQRHSYMIPVEDYGPDIHQSRDKRLYVSPFMDMGMSYDFDLSVPDERFRLLIRLSEGASDAGGKLMLTAGFSADREALSDQALMKRFWGLPLMTLKVVWGIHWEALKLWLKGVGFRHRQPGLRADIST